MKWEKIKFSALYAIPSKNGLTRPKSMRGRGYKMINMGELFANDRIWGIPMELVPMTDAEKIKNSIEKGDLLFARQSLVLEGAGKCCIVMDVPEYTTFESHLIRIRLNQEIALSDFYYYYFKSPLSPMKTIVQQCAQAGIRGSDLSELEVDYPSVPTQRRIADILSAYDDLIENNQKQIKLFEEAAMRLYKEWFANLRFPGHENTPIVDGIPEGWNRTRLKKHVKVNPNSISKAYDREHIQYIDISSVNKGRIENRTDYLRKDAPGRAKRLAKDGDTIWGMVRPNLKSYALVLEPDDNDVFSTGFAILSPESIPYTFLHCLVTQDDFVGYLVNCTD